MFHIAKSHSGCKLIHLCITSHIRNIFLIRNTEVFQKIQRPSSILVSKSYSSSLYCVKYLCGMEAEYTHISKICHAFSFVSLTEGMCRIIDYIQPMLFCNAFNSFHITYIAIYMHRHYSFGIFCYKLFYFFRIYCKIVFLDITKNRL